MEMIDPSWRKSSYSSGNGGNCLEIAIYSADLAVRDSKRPTGPTLRVSPSEWQTFLHAIKTHNFTS
ncbi:DUF397 domain-containing protein [Sphaerisporangium corydalis]|uniref:DUF397 domain-containing protein n=1 Tax=Sphaerisporangium corydalis TaxID=1441875 RepID=A0ABV9EHS6_9ACTN|nr:DUF397 domain-containing protein [Sphaerisporangium corydalis]